MKVIGIIPARYGSSRFPGKPLALINGTMMIERVYRQVTKSLTDVVVATDDERILNAVKGFGGNAVLTSPQCPNGTSRVYEAYRTINSDADVVINIQGDEPYIHPDQINSVVNLFEAYPETEIATLAHRFDPADGFEALFNPNRVKITMDNTGKALYFSRSIIPYVRNHPWQEWLANATFHTHIGLYGFRSHILREICSLPPSSLETAESLEQLQWLQNGYVIRAAITPHPSHPVDTPDDIQALNGL